MKNRIEQDTKLTTYKDDHKTRTGKSKKVGKYRVYENTDGEMLAKNTDVLKNTQGQFAKYPEEKKTKSGLISTPSRFLRFIVTQIVFFQREIIKNNILSNLHTFLFSYL